MSVQIKFTVTDQAAAYLRWFAKNILFESTENDAARHLMMSKLEDTRRLHRKDDPGPEDLSPLPSAEKAEKQK